jgi:hypothetical protein
MMIADGMKNLFLLMTSRGGTFENQYREIEKKINDHGIVVVLEKGEEDRWDPMTRSVYLDRSYSWEKRYYILLHELGHILIAKTSNKFNEDYPMYANSVDNRRTRSKAYRVSLIAEELEAWKRGRKMGKKMGHFIDDTKYDKLISDNVMSYIQWAANGGGE